MTLNGLITADVRYVCGSWFFMWPSQFGHWSWARDVNGRDRDETLVRLETVSVCFLNALYFWVT